jgi:dephospho-CoA kinase
MKPVVGLTGGIGAGKSAVSQILSRLGAVIIDADKVGHRIILPGGKAYDAVIREFGRETVEPDGTISRKRLGAIVFSDHEKLKRLDSIMHPMMAETMAEEVASLRKIAAADSVIVLEAAVLIEAGWDGLVDQVWVVVSDTECVIKRLAVRNKLSREEVMKRMRAQISDEERLKHADVVITNHGSFAEMEKQALAAWEKL